MPPKATSPDVDDTGVSNATDWREEEGIPSPIPSSATSSSPASIIDDSPVVPVVQAPAEGGRKRTATLPINRKPAKASRLDSPASRSHSSAPRTPGSKKRIVWNAERTAKVMRWFVDCHRDGLFKSTKKAFYRTAWDRVAELGTTEWPEYNLSAANVSDKYFNERRRYMVWKAWVGQSGETYDPEDGRVEINPADPRWGAFTTRFQASKPNWLLSKSLGPVDLYQELWTTDVAAGEYVSHPSQRGGGSVDSGLIFDEEEVDSGTDTGSADGEEECSNLSATQRHRRDHDPDEVRDLAEDSDDARLVDLERGKRRKGKKVRTAVTKELDFDDFGASITRAASLVAAPQAEGAGDISKAVIDIQKRFSSKLESSELLDCIEALQKPMVAVVWNALQPESKELYLERLKRT